MLILDWLIGFSVAAIASMILMYFGEYNVWSHVGGMLTLLISRAISLIMRA